MPRFRTSSTFANKPTEKFIFLPPLKACSYKYSDSQLLWILCLKNKDRACCCLRLIVISLCVCFSRPCLGVQGGVVQEFFNSSIALKDPHRTEDVTMADRLPSLYEVHVQSPEHLRTHTHSNNQNKHECTRRQWKLFINRLLKRQLPPFIKYSRLLCSPPENMAFGIL